jgi:circadian clock protein KaiC
VKKRSGEHETAIRSLHMSKQGLRIGEPLVNYRGVLSGIPNYERTLSPEPAK